MYVGTLSLLCMNADLLKPIAKDVAFVGDKASTVPAGSGSDAVSLKEIGDALIQKHFGSTGGANDTVSVDVGKNTSATGGNTVTTSKLKYATNPKESSSILTLFLASSGLLQRQEERPQPVQLRPRPS